LIATGRRGKTTAPGFKSLHFEVPQWKRWRHDEAFLKLIPIKVAKALQQQGVAPPQLTQIVAE
jgi:hypothetical protein